MKNMGQQDGSSSTAAARLRGSRPDIATRIHHARTVRAGPSLARELPTAMLLQPIACVATNHPSPPHLFGLQKAFPTHDGSTACSSPNEAYKGPDLG
jgi:hypothetical protein